MNKISKKKKLEIISSLMLLLTATIWGFAFVAQSVSMDYVDPCTFTFSRFLIGGVVLIPVIYFMNRNKSNVAEDKDINQWKTTLLAGVCCGLALGLGSIAQQYGVKYTTVGKAGFITALYIIIVPILGLFLKKKVHVKVWISAIIAVVGLYMICMTDSFSISNGDAMVLICAFIFSIQIMFVDYFSPKADPVKISCIQFFVAAIVAAIGAFIFEKPYISDILDALVPILYAGVLSSGVAYTLQVVAQRNTDPTIASLIMSLESVIATLAGWFMLDQHLSYKELAGCAVVFAAVILAQLPDRKKIKKEKVV